MAKDKKTSIKFKTVKNTLALILEEFVPEQWVGQKRVFQDCRTKMKASPISHHSSYACSKRLPLSLWKDSNYIDFTEYVFLSCHMRVLE